MAKLKSTDVFKIIGVALLFITIGLCQFHKPHPIQIPKQFWVVLTHVVTHLFMAVSGIKISKGILIKHVKGWITLTLIAMVGASIIYNIDVGKEWWSLLGAATAFLYGAEKEE